MRRRRAAAQSQRKMQARHRGLRALGRVRRGESPSLSHAARAEGTTVEFIRRTLPAAIMQARPGGRIRVKKGDPYSARVEILTDTGPLVVTARNSRERDGAGKHRATYMRVRRGDLPASALAQFRDKTVGGHKLVTDYAVLSELAEAGVMEQLDTLYVSPDISA